MAQVRGFLSSFFYRSLRSAAGARREDERCRSGLSGGREEDGRGSEGINGTGGTFGSDRGLGTSTVLSTHGLEDVQQQDHVVDQVRAVQGATGRGPHRLQHEALHRLEGSERLEGTLHGADPTSTAGAGPLAVPGVRRDHVLPREVDHDGGGSHVSDVLHFRSDHPRVEAMAGTTSDGKPECGRDDTSGLVGTVAEHCQCTVLEHNGGQTHGHGRVVPLNERAPDRVPAGDAHGEAVGAAHGTGLVSDADDPSGARNSGR